MLLWLCFALLTAAVVGLLLQPLRRAPATVMEPAAADLAVYRDQLRELDAERDRGLIIESEIENARAEVARRLIKRAEAEAESGPGAATTAAAETLAARARNAYAAVAVMIPLVGIALYLLTGSPHLSAHPFAERRTAEAGQSSVIELISRVEERLREHPEDGKGWDVIAPIYLRLGRFADSAHAFAEANRLEGESVRRLLGFAEATLLAGNGIVTEPVRRAALRVLELEPARKEVRVWLVLAKEQDGDLAGAAADYREILETAPADAPWRSAVSERLALITKKLGGDAPAEAPAGTPPAAPPGSATAPSAAAGAPAAPPQAAPPMPPTSPRCPRPSGKRSSKAWSTGSPRASRTTAAISPDGSGWRTPIRCSGARTMRAVRWRARAPTLQAIRLPSRKSKGPSRASASQRKSR